MLQGEIWRWSLLRFTGLTRLKLKLGIGEKWGGIKGASEGARRLARSVYRRPFPPACALSSVTTINTGSSWVRTWVVYLRNWKIRTETWHCGGKGNLCNMCQKLKQIGTGEGEGGITRPQRESNAAGRVRFSPEAFQKSFPFCIPGIWPIFWRSLS